MKVAIVTESFLPSLNGVTNSVLRVLDTLMAEGHEALVIAPTAPEAPHPGYDMVTIPFLPVAGFPVAIPTPEVTQALDRFRPDVIHAAAPFWLGGIAISYAAKKNIPSVAVYQTDVSGYMQRYGFDFAAPLLDSITAAVHRPASLTLAPTSDGVDYLSKIGITNVELWARGVDTDLFTPALRHTPDVAALRSSIAPEGEKIIGYVGRLAPEKQVQRMKELCGFPGTKLLIVGDGPMRAELKEIFRGHPVTFTGRLSGAELANAYAAMDLFVHCGTEETFGQTIQEAHAAGLPVIAPTKGGQRHLIRDGVDGYLVDATHWGSFRERAEALVADDVLRTRMSHAARDGVAHKTWDANNQKLVEIYQRLALTRASAVSAAA